MIMANNFTLIVKTKLDSLDLSYISVAAGTYEDTRTGPIQVLRPTKVPKTGPNQVQK